MSVSYKVIVVLLIACLSACNSGGERTYTRDYAAWSAVNGDGSWTRVTEAAVRRTSLPALVPADIREFCPRYPEINAHARVMFWTSLLSAMARFESDFDTDLQYVENLKDSTGRKVVSRGLLQLSVESANQNRYACEQLAPDDLHKPATNLTCAARILSTWVEADNVVAGQIGKNAGGARYWSVLRGSNRSREKIASATRQLEVCGDLPEPDHRQPSITPSG